MDRLSRLIRANVNDLIDRAEDPEKMLDQILRDMQTNIQSAREQVAAMIAQEKELELDYNEAEKLAREWGEKARRAVTAGKDDLAREALRRKRDNEENAGVYEHQVQAQKEMVEKLKVQMRQLESKYSTTLSQRDSLIARQRRARAMTKVTETMSGFSPMDPTADLDRMERQIRGNEARAMALSEMTDSSYEAQFRELGYDDDIEAELQILKAGGGANPAIEAELASLKGESDADDEPVGELPTTAGGTTTP